MRQKPPSAASHAEMLGEQVCPASQLPGVAGEEPQDPYYLLCSGSTLYAKVYILLFPSVNWNARKIMVHHEWICISFFMADTFFAIYCANPALVIIVSHS